jgi:hypothetical protein
MKDRRIAGCKPEGMPLDGMRMFSGDFDTCVELKAREAT